MNKKLTSILIVLISINLFSQNYNTSTFNNAINFDLIKSEISASYKLKSINFEKLNAERPEEILRKFGKVLQLGETTGRRWGNQRYA